MFSKKMMLAHVNRKIIPHRLFKSSILNNTWLCFGGYGLFLILIISGSIYYVARSLDRLHQSVIQFDQLSQDINVIHETFIRQAKNRKNLFLRGQNPTDLEKYSALVDNASQEIEQSLDLVLDNPLSSPYQVELNQFSRDYAQLMQVYRQGVALFLETQDPAVGDQYVRGQGTTVDQQLMLVLRRIQADRKQLVLETDQRIQHFLIMSAILFILIVVFGSCLLAVCVARPIRRIILFTRFLEESHQAGPGTQIELSASLAHHQEDEIGLMLGAYNKVSGLIRDYTQQLQATDGLLTCVNAAAQCLVANDELDVAVAKMLRILGEGTNQCRAYILNLSRDPSTDARLLNLYCEWDAPNIPKKSERCFPVPVDRFPDSLTVPIQDGQAAQFLARELDGIRPDDRMQGQARSLVGVPITVAGKWWGILGLDNCLTESVWSDAEIAVLETAATAVANAVERDRSRQAREIAEREALIAKERAAKAIELEAANQILMVRDRWLETTAAVAHELLSTTDVDASVHAALATIGKNVNCDRVGVMQYFSEPEGQFHILYEWDSPQTRAHILDPRTNIMLTSDFAHWTEQLIAGNCVGGAVTELEEPFRSMMKDLKVLSTYAVPIFFESGFWGFMFMDYCKQLLHLTPAELAGFNTAASCVGSAIYQAQMRHEREQIERTALLQQERQQATQKRVAELAQTNEALNRTLGTFAKSPELDEFLGYLLAELAQQTGACTTHLFLYQPKTHTLKQHCTVQEGQIYRGASPQDPEMSHSPIPADLTEGWQTLIDSPNPVIFTRLRPSASAHLSLCWPEMITWHRQQGHRTVVYLKLTVGNDPIGFIDFSFRRRARLTSEKVEFLQSLIHQATLAIQITQLAEQNQNAALLDERNRLAREIHDTLAQAFTGISLQLEAAKGMLTRKPESAQVHLQRAGNLARRGLSEARRSVRALRSQALETDSLAEALQTNLNEATQDSPLNTQFVLQGDPVLLSEDLQLNLLRIGQEAITNTLRHSQAKMLTLTLTFSSQHVGLRIVDDGVGFEVQSLIDVSGFGLVGIRERVDRFEGDLQIMSSPDAGTVIEVLLPIVIGNDNES